MLNRPDWRRLRRRAQRELQRGAGGLEQTWLRLRGRHLRLGITGFSGAGKTTLITSLIHHLSHPSAYRQSRFPPIADGVLLETRLLPLDAETPLFPYRQALASLAGEPPTWPQSTRGLSGALLELHLQRSRRARTARLELRDYPGEWLLDLPLLEQTYAEWSRETLALLDRAPRASHFADFVRLVQTLPPDPPMHRELADQLVAAYHEGLQRSRQAGLVFNQPGRALQPEWREGWRPFVPLPKATATASTGASPTLFQWFEQAYDDHVEQQLRPFFQHHFAAIDRQLILVDLLGLLRAGPEALLDFRLALGKILGFFQYGSSHALQRLFTPRVDRVIVVATKVDQLRQDQWENLRELLTVVVRDARVRAGSTGARVWMDACSAVRAIYPSRSRGETILVGTLADGRSGLLQHPDIPRDLPTEEQWQQLTAWPELPLRPQPAPGLADGAELRNYRLDAVLRELLDGLW